MRIAILGMDGYLGFSLLLHLLNKGHEVVGLDNFSRRAMVKEVGSISAIPIASMKKRLEAIKKEFGKEVTFKEGDVLDYNLVKTFFHKHKPEAICSLAQIPSAPYSMIDAEHGAKVQTNNVCGILNILWAMRDEIPKSSLTTLGTLSEWAFPNLPIPEGFFEVEFKGMKDILPFPRSGGSVYHTSKIQASHNVWFACRIWELRVSDIHQGVVVGTRIPEMNNNLNLRTRMDCDSIWGTFVNRAVVCTVMGHPILAYGSGMQTRGYIALRDSIKCLTLSLENHPTDDDSIHGWRVINQFDETYSCNQLAKIVQKVGTEKFDLNVQIEHIENPRVEAEVHFYQPIHEKLYKMGWKPTKTIEEELEIMFRDLIPHKERMLRYKDKIVPKIRWRPNRNV